MKGGRIMLGEYKDYVDIKDALTNLLEAGYTIPMIKTVLEQIIGDKLEEDDESIYCDRNLCLSMPSCEECPANHKPETEK